jgi:hypothetical protein
MVRGELGLLVLSVALLGAGGTVHADIVKLKDGQVHHGRKIGETTTAIGFKTRDGRVIAIRKGDIVEYKAEEEAEEAPRNPQPPVVGAKQLCSVHFAYEACIAPGRGGSMTSLRPDVQVQLLVHPQGYIYVLLHLAPGAGKKALDGARVSDQHGKLIAKEHARAWADRYRQAKTRLKGHEPNPVLTKLKDQRAVKLVDALVSGRIFRDRNDVLLIFKGGLSSLEGLHLQSARLRLPLKVEPSNVGTEHREKP